MILICVNELSGPTGYHKSVVETANALHRGGYPLAVLSFLGAGDGAELAMPRWPLDPEIPAYVLQTLPAEGGRLLAENVHPVLTGRVYATRYAFTAAGHQVIGVSPDPVDLHRRSARGPAPAQLF
ncbi:MAG: hypothetical protein LOY01_14130 [Brachybacterium paraconglomeratum]|nr:hypothetical protein [Brachybacterium paraconglomeratum]